MLTYARTEQGTPALKFQAVDLDALLERVIQSCRRCGSRSRWYAATARVRMRQAPGSMPNPATCTGRCRTGGQCHAARRIPGQVELSIGPERCRIDVEDDGPGIPEGVWDRIFTPFTRLDDSRTRLRRAWPGVVDRAPDHLLARGRAMVGRSEALGGACFSLIWPSHRP